jgi:hypothetical protein
MDHSLPQKQTQTAAKNVWTFEGLLDMLPLGLAAFICASSVDLQTVHSRLPFLVVQESRVVGAIRYNSESYDTNDD